jgi:hypothetical protein
MESLEVGVLVQAPSASDFPVTTATAHLISSDERVRGHIVLRI